MATTRKLEVIIAGDASGAQRAFDKTESGAQGLAGKMKSSLGSIPLPVAAAAAAGVAIVTNVLTDAYDAALESQRISKETERVIETTGAASWITADHVSALATSLSEIDGIDDEKIQGVENLLLTFTQVQNKAGDGNDVFNQATGLALDLATALGTDANDAAIQLGKALNDPIAGMTALSRSGVSFTEDQKDQIKALAESGDLLGAQKIILGEVAREFGGAAEAAATPMDRLGVVIGNLQEDLGAKLIPIVEQAATWLGENLPPIIDWLEEHAGIVAVVVGTTLTAAFVALGAAVLSATWPFLLIGGVVAALVAGVIYAYNNWDTFRNVVNAVASFLTNVVWPAIQAFYQNFMAGVEMVKQWWSDHWDQISAILSSAWDLIKNVVSNAWQFISNSFEFFGNLLTGKWGAAWDNIKGMVSAAWDAIKNIVANGWDILKNGFTLFADFVGGIGQTMWDGIKNGFRSAFNWIIDKWNGLSFSIPSVDLGPLGSWGGGTVDFPDVPRLHSGGTFNAPPGQTEGLALLRNGERVVTPEQQRAGGGTTIVVQGHLVLEKDLLQIMSQAQAKGYRPAYA